VPAVRGTASTLRWENLRDDAGFVVAPAPIKSSGDWFSLYGR